MLSNASVSTESSGPVADLASMVSELIVKGNGIKKANSLSVAKPYGSLVDVKYNAVVLNYAHHSEKTDETSWHYCLKQMKNNLSDKGQVRRSNRDEVSVQDAWQTEDFQGDYRRLLSESHRSPTPTIWNGSHLCQQGQEASEQRQDGESL